MKTLLHVGCGSERLNLPDHEEITVDAEQKWNPDIVADFRSIPREPNSCDVVFAKHCLEHIPWPEVLPTLTHWKSLLRPGGKVHVRVPDLECVARAIVFRSLDHVMYQSPMGPVTARSMLYGHEPDIGTHPGMRHQTGFTEKTLMGVLKEAGFTQCEGERHPYELRAEGVKA